MRGNFVPIGIYRVVFSCLTDKHPPDASLALRHTPSIARFKSKVQEARKRFAVKTAFTYCEAYFEATMCIYFE